MSRDRQRDLQVSVASCLRLPFLFEPLSWSLDQREGSGFIMKIILLIVLRWKYYETSRPQYKLELVQKFPFFSPSPSTLQNHLFQIYLLQFLLCSHVVDMNERSFCGLWHNTVFFFIPGFNFQKLFAFMCKNFWKICWKVHISKFWTVSFENILCWSTSLPIQLRPCFIEIDA